VNAQAKNLEAISKAIDQHNRNCPWPAAAVAMHPHEVDRLGWEEIRGLPIVGDSKLCTGSFRIICGRDELPGADEAIEQRETPETVPSSPDRHQVFASVRAVSGDGPGSGR
jgi:hypothetical protein